MKATMKKQLQLEGAGLFLLFILTYIHLEYELKWFFLLFFMPDLSFLFYAWSRTAGTIAYNFLHHQGIFAILGIIGFWASYDPLTIISLSFLAHSAFDRIFGYGLKYTDSFHHTHLGRIGKSRN